MNQREEIKKEENRIDSNTKRNLAILIAGAGLVILAIIVFLITAWKDIPNTIKIIVLIAFEFLFIGSEFVTKEKLKLENVSKALFYIAMAYLPICFISISVLKLLGEYLSIYGKGKYIFLSISSIIMSLVYYIQSNKRKDEYMIYASIVSQIASVIFTTLIFSQNVLLIYSSLLLYNIIIIKMTKNEIFKTVSVILPSIITIGVLSQIGDNSWFFVIGCLLLAINFLLLELKKSNIYTAILFNLSLYMFTFGLIFKRGLLIIEYSYCQWLMMLFILGFFVINELINNKSNKRKDLLNISRICSLIVSVILYIYAISMGKGISIPLYQISILIEFLIILNYISTKNVVYKYLSYAFINIIFINLYMHYSTNMEFLKLIPMITTSAIIFFELFNNRKNNKNLEIFLGIIETVSLVCLSLYNTTWVALLTVAFSTLIVIYNKKANNNIYYNLIPLLGILPSIVNNNLSQYFRFYTTLIITMILTFASVITEKKHIYKIISCIYIAALSLILNNEYFAVMAFILWCMIQLICEEKDVVRDILKTVLTVFMTILYYLIIRDLRITDITLFKLAGIVIGGMYIIRTVFTKYSDYAEVCECIFWIVIYIFAISDYKTFQDGIIFSVFILFIIFFSYYKRYGATVLVSTTAIVVNSIYLTREFWKAIPWWIYLLLVGGVLIAFAINNELNKNNPNKITFKSIVQKYKTTFKNNEIKSNKE